MDDIDLIAGQAYEAYGTVTGHRTHSGELMPAWTQLPDQTRRAWRAAAAQAAGEPVLDQYITGLIRTAVPVIVGAALTYLAVHFGIVIPTDASAGLVLGVAALAIGGYYALVHAIEKKFPGAGRWLLALGLTRAQPSYRTHRQ